MILPAMGVITEVISGFSRKPIFGYKAIAYSQRRHRAARLPGVGPPHVRRGPVDLAGVIFSFLTFFVAIPAASRSSTGSRPCAGAPSASRADALRARFIVLFTIGGLTGLFLGMLAVDIHLHDTYFVVAHFHYVMVGGTLMGFFAGLHYWWPKITGRMYSEKLARVAVGAVLRRVQHHVLSPVHPRGPWPTAALPPLRRTVSVLHVWSTFGSWILGAGFLVMLYYLVHSLQHGERATRNPWGAHSLEWKTALPPITENFVHQPVVTGGPYDFVPGKEAS